MAPVVTAITGFLTAFASTAVGAFLTQTIIGRLLVSVVASLILQALAPKPKPPGIRTSVTQTGGTNPLTFMLGRYATAGTLVAPPMSQGAVGDFPNGYLTYVVEVSSLPGATLAGLIVNDSYVDLDVTTHPNYGFDVQGDLAGFMWVKYYDGSQTVADPMLLAKFGSDPDRPWTADMIGTGICYAILTFKFNRKVWNGLPKVRFVMDGIPLYDPRQDDTVGGTGSQRWNDSATWAQTNNPLVMAYNIMRGITLPDGAVWGGQIAEADLPLANWFTAMNACDATVSTFGGGSEPRYRAGYEAAVTDEPADVLGELYKVSLTQTVDIAGVWKVRTGPPGLPVLAITDDDIIASRAQDLNPFPGLDRTANAIHCTYPEPDAFWEPKDASMGPFPIHKEQDEGRELFVDMNFPACPWNIQVKRLMWGYIDDERRFRTHALVLPPEAAVLEPLDVIAWTSTANGYSDYDFEVTEISDSPGDCLQIVHLKQGWGQYGVIFSEGGLAAPDLAGTGTTDPAAISLAGFAAAGLTIVDDAGTSRAPAIKLSWTATDIPVDAVLRYEVRPTGQSVVIRGLAAAEALEVIVTEGIAQGRAYQARAMRVSGENETAWTSWTGVTAPAVPAVSLEDRQSGLTENLIHDPTFLHDFDHWGVNVSGTTGTETSASILAAGAAWSGRSYRTLALYQNGTSSDGWAQVTNLLLGASGLSSLAAIPARAGQWLEFTVFAAPVRCTGTMLARWYDDTLTQIGATETLAIARNDAADSTDPAQWPRAVYRSQAPSGTAYAAVTFRKNPTASPETDSYLYLALPQVARAHENALSTVPFTWAPARPVTSFFTSEVAGPVLRSTLVANYVIATLAVTPVANHTFLRPSRLWMISATFEGKEVTAVGSNFDVTLARRTKVLGGAFGTWVDLKTWDIAYAAQNGNAAWDIYNHAALDVGPYDEMELKLYVKSAPTGSTGSEGIQNVQLAYAEVCR